MNNIFVYFPNVIKNILKQEINDEIDFLEEIRIRNQKPIVLKFNNKEKIINYLVTSEEIITILQCVCENSIYSYQHQIAEGYITINGGHRVGISGSCVIENGKVININYINSLNFRLARQIKDISKNVLNFILDINENTIFNTLIVSKPGARKNNIIKRCCKANFKWNR